ncbi:hypothetical protein T03_2086 [Trichinella britovi]|uniref:Uncharacterized protein n=1 Tax=Trichinella britovi TaxID=45882 RepID=A0A0V1CA24_TRIBR|nr:hypothetical protein T03_2086 [Trichinella britovi]
MDGTILNVPSMPQVRQAASSLMLVPVANTRRKSIIDHKAAVLGVNLNPQTIICDFETALIEKSGTE